MSNSTAVPEAELAPPVVAVHGASRLTAVTIDAYNSLLREDDGFVGDRARRAAFFKILDHWRELAEGQDHPLIGDVPTQELSKKTLDEAFAGGTPQEQAVILSAVEDYARELVAVIKRFVRSKDWRDTQRIAVGGGLKSGRFAEIAIARAELLARADELDIELRPIRNDPDEAGMLGAAHLAPSWMFGSFDNILGVDIGGTNMRAGIIKLNLEKATDLSRARVHTMDLWRHGDEDDMKRDVAIDRLVDMLKDLIRKAEKEDIKLAPFIGIGCPGEILHDGSIKTGAQNLPGNWESSRFNLPHEIWEAIPSIGGRETTVIMHNDAVVQGLSEAPFMQDVTRWGVLTIGTGLGNARFTNRAAPKSASNEDKPAKGAAKKGAKSED